MSGEKIFAFLQIIFKIFLTKCNRLSYNRSKVEKTGYLQRSLKQ